MTGARVISPSGEQHVIEAAGYRAVVTESGGALRLLTHDATDDPDGPRDLVDGFAEDEMSSGGRGQQLVPWPNRLRDGRYTFEDRDLQLPLTEPKRHNASHGLGRWAAWSLLERTEASLTLGWRLMAQTGYPFPLALQVTYALGEDGLRVTQAARNLGGDRAPWASGAHPYLTLGAGPVDGWTLSCPGTTRLLTDPERLLPTGREPVAGTPYDFTGGRPIGDVQLNHAYGDLARDADGTATTRLSDPGTGRGVELWVDERHRWLMLYTADDIAATARRSLAVEPMTAPTDAFNSGEDLQVLAPAGEEGDTAEASWGIRATARA